MTDYNFFKTLSLVDTGRTKPPKTTTPEGMTVRVMANGKIYPSKDLTEKYNLEYQPATVNSGNGIDIVDTSKWAILAAYPRAILFGITPKTEAKVDLFASCRHHEDGTPKASVLTQGAVNDTLVDLVKQFGWLTADQTFVDLKVLEECPFKTQDGIAYIPKTIAKGAKAGEDTYSRRENVTFFPVMPSDLVETEVHVESTELITETN